MIANTMIPLIYILCMGLMSCQMDQGNESVNDKIHEMGKKALDQEIKIVIGKEEFIANLYDNPTSRSLIKQMPFSVELEDYAGIEKIFYPDPKLSTDDAPAGADPTAGDIMLYAPWGDVAIFYKDFKYASGLIPMGRLEDIDGFVEALKNDNRVTFKID